MSPRGGRAVAAAAPVTAGGLPGHATHAAVAGGVNVVVRNYSRLRTASAKAGVVDGEVGAARRSSLCESGRELADTGGYRVTDAVVLHQVFDDSAGAIDRKAGSRLQHYRTPLVDHCADIVEDFSQAMLDFWNDDARRTCKNCGAKVQQPQAMQAL